MEDIDGDYELEVLFELRQRERDEAEQRYAEAQERHRKIGRRVQKLEHRQQEMTEKRKNHRQSFEKRLGEGGYRMIDVQNFDRFIAGLRADEQEIADQLAELRRRHRRAREEMERAHRALTEAIREFKAVEQHYEDWQQEREVVERRRRDAKMDDIAARTWRDNQ